MAENTKAVADALARLDPDDDEHWTVDGLPRIDVVERLSGLKGLRRGDITEAGPRVHRTAVEEQGEGVGDLPADVRSVGTQSQPPTMAPPPGTDPSPQRQVHRELAEAQARLEETSKDLQAATTALAEATSRHQAASAAHDRAVLRVEEAAGPRSVTSDIRHYLDSQERLRHQRAAQRSEALAALGVNPGRAQIDAAMARRTGYGRNRPQYPANTSGAE